MKLEDHKKKIDDFFNSHTPEQLKEMWDKYNYLSKSNKTVSLSDVMSSKNFTLTYDELLLLLKEAYRNGYATHEMTDAGLEPYDADGYARWVLSGLK